MDPLEGCVTVPPDDELVLSIVSGTNRRVRNLQVLKNCTEVIIMGSCSSFYIKQLAQESIRSKLPMGYRIKNAIIVEPD
jgi:hypothetical protein